MDLGSDIRTKIFVIREQQVMLDRDLAELYGVETKVLNQAVKRNIERFPENFMFQLNDYEYGNWRSHFVTSIPNWSHFTTGSTSILFLLFLAID